MRACAESKAAKDKVAALFSKIHASTALHSPGSCADVWSVVTTSRKSKRGFQLDPGYEVSLTQLGAPVGLATNWWPQDPDLGMMVIISALDGIFLGCRIAHKTPLCGDLRT